ncbi:tubulin epsilon and delta complex protein 2 isoform X9 [Elephas maximus indicus]|uniref:tubulin epsilon and delta complex protein 2 isoform X9 n=1 Tax=Elephas maximus indicus TaxID=99487 RepID=UPI002116F02F|nr:tubulin epsilon and delta complex protein 2 isoform X9 [Elephas maximus indicus]
MLPADCSLRLVAELRAALDACGEQQRQLDQSLRVCRRLLRAWEPTRPAAPEPTPGPEPNEEDPSPACAPSLQDLTELELLTQALEKAVRDPAATAHGLLEGSVPKCSCPLIPQGLWGSFLAFRRARHPSCGPAWPCPAGWNNWHPSPDSWVLVCPSLWAQIDSTQASDSANAAARTRFLLKMQAAVSCQACGSLRTGGRLKELPGKSQHGMTREALGSAAWATVLAPTDCVQEYRCLLLLEGLQATVGQCLHWLQELRKVVAKHHLELCPSGMPARASCLCEGGADAAWSPQPLLYSSTQELQTLAALRLRVAMLDQQLHLEKVLMDELLPLVRTQRPCCAAVCRAVHSLLCNGGQHFPTVLQDEPAD